MKPRWLLLAVSLLILVALVVAACGPAPTPPLPPPTEAATETPAPEPTSTPPPPPPTETPMQPAQQPDPTKVADVGGFAGQWDTTMGDMTCSVDGVTVYCEYTYDQGRIDATLSDDGRTMDGQWSESPSYSPPYDAGPVTGTLSEDGNAIDGQWWYGETSLGGYWTGTRK